ncbi:thioredoxin family protein [Cellulomonas sp. HZM]|uniref:thioredoxin family protein n=1 Tax=Cellulomonas sp. HZM TaxID=1454010 RepID=UPI0005545D2E|nr:thioredoxin family protein [Cellulomonas sp. HZM]
MGNVLVVVGVLAVAGVLGLVWRARTGRFASAGSASADDEQRLTPADIGADLGARATFVQLSAEVCSACRSTARVLGAIHADDPDVQHVELDVADHLDLVRTLGVMRTPTTVLLDSRGAVVGRLVGGTDRAQALAALAQVPTNASVHPAS